MSNRIHKLKKGNKTIYPATVSDAVVHPGIKRPVTELFRDYNVSELWPEAGIDGRKYTLDLAINILSESLPSKDRRVGTKLTFIPIDSEHPNTYEWRGGDWFDSLSWGRIDSGYIETIKKTTVFFKKPKELEAEIAQDKAEILVFGSRFSDSESPVRDLPDVSGKDIIDFTIPGFSLMPGENGLYNILKALGSGTVEDLPEDIVSSIPYEPGWTEYVRTVIILPLSLSPRHISLDHPDKTAITEDNAENCLRGALIQLAPELYTLFPRLDRVIFMTPPRILESDGTGEEAFYDLTETYTRWWDSDKDPAEFRTSQARAHRDYKEAVSDVLGLRVVDLRNSLGWNKHNWERYVGIEEGSISDLGFLDLAKAVSKVIL